MAEPLTPARPDGAVSRLRDRNQSPLGRFSPVPAGRVNREHRSSRGNMTTLENRPNTALLVVDVQKGVVEGAPERDAVVANVGSLVEKARGEHVPVVWVQHSDKGLARGSDEWQIVPELSSGRRRAAHREALRRLLRGHHPRDRIVGPRCRAPRRRRRTDRCVYPLDAARRVRQGIRRDARQRCPHDGGPDGMGRAAAGPGDRAHEPVLDLPDGPGRTAGTVETKDVDFGGRGDLERDAAPRRPSPPRARRARGSRSARHPGART